MDHCVEGPADPAVGGRWKPAGSAARAARLGGDSPPAYPGERWIACRNPLWAEERKRKREALLSATEKPWEKDSSRYATQRRPLRGQKEIDVAVGQVLGHYQMGKPLQLNIEEDRFDLEAQTGG